MSMPTEQRCVTCGAELAAFATEGFCSACLLERGLTGAPTEALPLRSFGDYELIEEIARGGMGVVYKARQAGLNRIVAVKMILSGQFASTAETQRFRAEARSAAALQHPGIVAIHEVGEHDGLVYFSMDFVEGHNLAQLIRDGPWSAARAAQCVRDIAAAIHYAHEHGVLHRDLKPSNVLIDANGKPRVTDFGLAKRLVAAEVTRLTSALSPGGEGRGEGGRSSEPKEDQSLLTSAATEELTLSGQVLGSPNFMPPEQAAGKHRELTPASDVYSLGALLYHLLTGRPPFLADNIPATLRLVSETEPVAPRLLVPTVPRDLETICLKCLDKNPRHRYATAQELSDELARFLRDEPIRARPVAPAEKLARWARRNPKVAGLSAALVVVLAAGFAGVLVQLQRANRHAAAETHERDRAERTAREEARTRVQAEELLRQLQMQRAEDLLAGDRASAALLILTERLRSHPSDAGAAHRVLWELGRRDFALPLGPALTHSQYVAMARFSADGHRVLTASFAGTARVWNAHTGEPLTPFMAHDASIMGAAFSPDGTRVVTCAADGTVRVWDGHTGQPLMPVLRHSAVVHWVAFSPDGLQFVSAGEDAARIWETQTGRLRHELSEHQGPVVFAIFSPDGKKVVTAAHDGTARIWRTKDGKPAVPALAHPVFVKGAYFSPDGTLVVTWSNDSCVRVWSANTGELVSGPLAHENDVCEATFSADSQRIVSGAWDRTAQVWEARTGKKLTRTLPHPSGVTTARFDASGDRVVTACWDGSARIWNAHTGQPLSEPFRQGQGLRWAEFSPDGERVVTASR
ncbi:MAG TPA: serine/threonine-protein kinase, partial [Methylomirabilota bacterium]|nr:serine/threonine-protein kinase [Methylomirabilota bacterium]